MVGGLSSNLQIIKLTFQLKQSNMFDEKCLFKNKKNRRNVFDKPPFADIQFVQEQNLMNFQSGKVFNHQKIIKFKKFRLQIHLHERFRPTFLHIDA